ncbi:DeoR/GlpR family DNA-binding transcription regulator [Rhizobium sp. C4]|uniref:DeoR/GlpR family DNA-binding transcription regulator n=1 Tax=Rhizobium sp. C4 TaxID=1349800 RepID=UPI001E410CF5|nr:DeoR/GlpR family DNA-binding transcription regulator [Rhizobium sp. C4]MCD2171908.1 DeoR/GlpR family DNA-binding transcription regulator [Rhizobium sp. C4]
MLTTERKGLILETLRREGRIVAKTFASQLALSEDTIRKDLREMAAEGLLARVHGGALPLSSPLPDFAARTGLAHGEKRALGRAAATLIEPGGTVFFDGGTTNAELIRALPETIAFTAITHSPTIAAEFERLKNVEVTLIGGRLYRHSMVAVGTDAALAIGAIRPDLFFMGATAATADAGFSTGDAEEASIKRLIARQSRDVWVLLTAEKVGLQSPFSIMPLAEATGVVLDAAVTESETAVFEQAGVLVRKTEALTASR